MIAGARVAGAAGGSSRGLLFVHGVGSTAAIWDAQLQEFATTHRCAAIELRGNGASKPDPDPASISREAFAADAITLLDALGIERFTLIGCSLGGVVAFELWRSVANRFDGMLILGSFARYPEGEGYAANVVAAVREAGSMPEFARRRAAQLGLPPQRTAETIEQMACKSVPCYIASTYATWTGDYRDVLPAIDVPALVAYGERDAVAPRGLAQEIADGIPNARLIELPDAGHVANADNPIAFNGLLRGFLRELEA